MDAGVVTVIERLLDDVDSLDHVGLAKRLQDAERLARVVESVKATIVATAERTEAFGVDGHRSVRNWVQATIRVPRGAAVDVAQVAALCAAHSVVFDHLAAATLPIAAAHALAKVHANRRVTDQFADVVDAFVVVAERTPHVTFLAHLRQWERLADDDGPTPDPAVRRTASCTTVDDVTYLRAVLYGVAAAEVAEVLDRFAEAEFAADCDQRRAERSADDAEVGVLARTEAQRRADAVAAVFRRAAAAHPGARDPEPVVNLIASQAVFDEALRAVIEARQPNFDLLEPTRVWSETHNDISILPAELLAAAAVGHVRRVVVDTAGVIIDLGQRRRVFTGAAATAAELQHALDRAGRCLWPGCGLSRTQHDHVAEWHRNHGPTNVRNEGPLCVRHNRIKTRGYRTWRDQHGVWHTQRPNGTEITAA